MQSVCEPIAHTRASGSVCVQPRVQLGAPLCYGTLRPSECPLDQVPTSCRAANSQPRTATWLCAPDDRSDLAQCGPRIPNCLLGASRPLSRVQRDRTTHMPLNALGARDVRGQKASDLALFDDMIEDEGIVTEVRGLPNSEYCTKLRSWDN